jgi:hypothetical protein
MALPFTASPFLFQPLLSDTACALSYSVPLLLSIIICFMFGRPNAVALGCGLKPWKTAKNS